MYERFSPAVRHAMYHVARRFARRRGDDCVHTGHILFALFDAGATCDVRYLSSVTDAATQISNLLSTALPDEPIKHRRWFVRPCSEAVARSIEIALCRTRQRQSRIISTADVIVGLLSSGPNIAVYILETLGSDLRRLRDELEAARE